MKNLSTRSLQYYVIAKKWGLDLEFFKFEISFLKQLINNNILKDATADVLKLRQARERLQNLERDYEHTFELLDEQSKVLELMAEDVIPEDIGELAAKQISLEYMMANITNDFRAIKREIYALISSQLSNNKSVQN